MMRALWTAGTGMMTQQFNVDVISNNLANVNTTGYKKEKAEFKDLLYETLDKASVLDGKGRPVNLQVGHGAVAFATVKNYEKGNIEKTDSPLDFFISGEGFFKVNGPTGNVQYTRDGSFKISIGDDGAKKLTTSEGYPVLADDDSEILINVDVSRLNVSSDGELSYTTANGGTESLGMRIGLVKFPNRYGLENAGNNLYNRTSASGEPVTEGIDDENRSVINQGFLEGSNVQVVEEMVKLIVAQRAYEVNSKSIQSADDMLGMANNLKR